MCLSRLNLAALVVLSLPLLIVLELNTFAPLLAASPTKAKDLKISDAKLRGGPAKVTPTPAKEKPETADLSAAAQVKTGVLEDVASFNEMMPRGVAVTAGGRIFVCFPRQEGQPYTLGELKKDGTVSAYPDEETNKTGNDPKTSLVSAMAAYVDDKNRLWVLDSGRAGADLVAGAPKLIAFDLDNGTIVKNIPFEDDVCLATTVLKDFRVQPKQGKEGTAMICDSSPTGKSAIIVTDLETGKSLRRLSGHPTVEAEPNFVIFAEGEMVRHKDAHNQPQPWTAGVTGLALGDKGNSLYYSPMAGLNLFSVSVQALCDPSVSEEDVEKTVKLIFREVGTSDGLESDSQGRLYLTDVENNEVWLLKSDGTSSKVVKDLRLVWPDRLCLTQGGYLYITASQFNRGPWFHYGQDLRTRPYHLYRVKVDAKPLQL